MIENKPVRWDVYIKLAQKEDAIDKATLLWPESRKRQLVGQVIIGGARDNEAKTQQCDKSIFNPLLQPKGIAP